MIVPGSRVLDIGSGDGTLIDHLFRTRQCDARGIEISMEDVTRAVAHGLPVMHGDAITTSRIILTSLSIMWCFNALCRLSGVPGSAETDVAHRPLRDRVIPKFCAMALETAVSFHRANADDACLEHALV